MAKMKSTDPAYFMLFDEHTSKPMVYNKDCCICKHPEYAKMGLPLCYACYNCGGHVPADDVVCDECGKDQEV